MKSSLPLFLLLPIATLLFTQCVVVEDGSQGTSSPAPNVSGSPEQSKQVYDMGLDKGFVDGQRGLSRSPDRHAGTYPAVESDAFTIGYEAGYNKGIR